MNLGILFLQFARDLAGKVGGPAPQPHKPDTAKIDEIAGEAGNSRLLKLHEYREELQQAVNLGLDFAVLSPVMKTLSHPDARPLGLSAMAELITNCPIPVYALGGMTIDQLHEIQSHGAHGIAMLRNAWL